MNALVSTQLQIKRNAEEVSSFVDDLNTWRSSVSQNERAIVADRAERERQRAAAAATVAAAPAAAAANKASAAPIRGARAPAVKAAAAATAAPSTSTSTSTSTTTPITAEALALYDAEKAQGNAAFAARDYSAACAHYTACLAARPGDATALSNRAQALLLLDAPSLAERDCTAALADTDITTKLRHKLLYRRAVARRAIGATAGALEDVAVVVWGAGGANKEAAELQRALQQDATQCKQWARAAEDAARGRGVLLAVNRADDAEAVQRATAMGVAKGPAAGAGAAAGAGDGVVFVSVEEAAEEEDEAAVAALLSLHNVDVDEEEEEDAGAGAGAGDDDAFVPLPLPMPMPLAAPAPALALTPSSSSAAPAAPAATSTSTSTDSALPPPARSAAEFLSTLSALSAAPATLGAWLLTTPAPAKRLPKLLPSVMDAALVDACLTALLAVLGPEAQRVAAAGGAADGSVVAVAASKFLCGLARVDRFALALALVGAEGARRLGAVRATLRGIADGVDRAGKAGADTRAAVAAAEDALE